MSWRGVLVLVLVSCCVTTMCHASAVFDDQQEIAVQNVFKHMLRLQPPANSRVVKPPQHMMELYQKYSHAGGLEQTSGNTVRSILPTLKGSSPTSQMLVFNVTCVDQAEEVNLAQLHLHRRRLPRDNAPKRRRRILAAPYRVRLFQVLDHRSRVIPLASLPVSQHARAGWHSLDITEALRELLLSTSSSSLQLGVRFEAPKNRPITHELFLKATNETSAFLVVFSDDNSLLADETRALNHVRHTHALAAMLQHTTGRVFETWAAQHAVENRTNDDLYLETTGEDMKSEATGVKSEEHNNFESFMKQGSKKTQAYSKQAVERDDTIDEELSEQQQVKKKLRTQPRYGRVHPKTRYRVRPRNDVDMTEKRSVKRRRETDDERMTSRGRAGRSIVDNELPDTLPRTGALPQTSPGILLKTRDEQEDDEIPLPSRASKRGRGGGGRKRGRGKKREGRKKGKKAGDNWHQNVDQSSQDWHENYAMDKDSSSTCHKSKLVVDFADIGWSDWIISPPKFEAHYCMGQCVYPLNKALRPTNHATIQSLVHAIDADVPDPCCVPDKLSPMSLLYLDDNNNVVLRSYHDMTVESCACR